jgi:hypothetical protein
METHCKIILSGSNFFRKIMDKYRIRNIISFRFPSMILFKYKQNFSMQKINVDIFIQVLINNRNITSSIFFSKKVENIKKVFSRWSEKTLQTLIIKSASLKISRIENRQSIVNTIISRVHASHQTLDKKFFGISSIQPAFSNVKNTTFIRNASLYPLFSSSCTISHSQMNRTVSRSDKTLNYTILNHNYHMQITKISGKSGNSMTRTEDHDISIQTNQWQYQNIHENSIAVILPSFFSLHNNRTQALEKDIFNRNFQNYTSISYRTLKYHTNLGYAPDNSSKKKITPDMLLYFDTHRNREEIEEIKRTVSEINKSVIRASVETSGSGNMDVAIKHHLDLNRISDQVYQNIERRIRTERERRGL